jgi:hypothetical protein
MAEPTKKRVLFLCTGNSARSQMAEALMRDIGRGRFEVVSAGTDPRDEVHPEALAMLRGHGITTEGLVPKALARFDGERFDYVNSPRSCRCCRGTSSTRGSSSSSASSPSGALRRSLSPAGLVRSSRNGASSTSRGARVLS